MTIMTMTISSSELDLTIIKSMKIITVGLIISTLVMSSIVLTPLTSVQASNKGLKIYLTVETNLNDDVTIDTYQYGDRVYTHDGFVNTGRNEITLQYPSRLIDTGEFRIWVNALNDGKSARDSAYNSEAKQPEHVFINLFRDFGDEGIDNSQSQGQSQSQSQAQTVIICPANSRCVIEQ
jgi:hypothetical protein